MGDVMMERVPFLDLAAEHQALREEIAAALAPIFDGARFVGGDAVSTFEARFAALHGLPWAVGLKSGTAALHLGLEALGVGPGDEVLVPAFTFIATAAPVVRLGAVPRFVDVDPEVATLNPEAAAAAITPRTRAMIPVHLYGHPAPVDLLFDLAREHGLRVLEDCAQSHLATWRGRPCGSFGDAGAYSFYPTKNLGAAGDAGALVTADQELADRVRGLGNHGRADRYRHVFLGWNERMDAIQAAVLTVKLNHLAAWTEARRAAAARYQELLRDVAPYGEPLRLPVERDGARAVYHLYVARHSRRDAIADKLGKAGIDTATHYPLTVPEQPAFVDLGLGGGHFPVAEDWARHGLSLPLYPGITASQQERVAEALRALPA